MILYYILLYHYYIIQVMFYCLGIICGLGRSVTISCLLGVASDLCTTSQLPLLFGLKLLLKGIGGMTLLPLACKLHSYLFNLIYYVSVTTENLH